MLRLLRKSLQTGIVTTSYPQQPDQPAIGFQGLPQRDQEKCGKCGHCAGVCPTGAIEINGIVQTEISDFAHVDKADFVWSVDPKKCLFCGFCTDHCPRRALSISRKYELAMTAGKETVRKVFGCSAHIRHLDVGSCNGCDWEMTTLTGPVYDVQRLGFDFVASPRHADILMVTGPVTRNLEIAARKTFEATPAPKLVIAVGTCACSGGICGRSYASAGGVNNVLPVDVYIPGCPPRPQALIHGLCRAVGRL